MFVVLISFPPFNDFVSIGTAEEFFLAVMVVPQLHQRLQSFLYALNFEHEHGEILNNITVFAEACEKVEKYSCSYPPHFCLNEVS